MLGFPLSGAHPKSRAAVGFLSRRWAAGEVLLAGSWHFREAVFHPLETEEQDTSVHAHAGYGGSLVYNLNKEKFEAPTPTRTS